MSAPWEIAWDASKYEVGRAMHSGWRRQKIANGFADHPFKSVDGVESAICMASGCGLGTFKHHADMIDWDALPEHQQAINYEGGREGFRLGFEAGTKAVFSEMDARGMYP